MFDVKILMILCPLWLATVGVTLYWGLTRPKASRLVAVLLERGCRDPESALPLSQLGLASAGGLLRKGSALRRVVMSAEEETSLPGGAMGALKEKPELRYYLPPEAEERARAMYGHGGVKLWQSLLWIPVLTAFFFLLWMAGSLVLDTTGWKPLFRI